MKFAEIIIAIQQAQSAAKAIESLIDGFRTAAKSGEGFTEAERAEILREAGESDDRIRRIIEESRSGGGE